MRHAKHVNAKCSGVPAEAIITDDTKHGCP